MINNLRSRARALKVETTALYYALRDPRTPWYARAVVLLTLVYALSPIDLIPDFVPVLGYLDDLVIIPAGIALALRLIPTGVMNDARLAVAVDSAQSRRLGWLGAGLISLAWFLILLWLFRLLWQLVR